MTVPKHMKPQISVKLENVKAMPFRAHPTDAGADLFSNEEIAIYPLEKKLIDTGVAIAIPVGFVGLICSRSSQGKIEVSIPHSLGIIDSAYRGNLKVLLKNNGDEPYFISKYATRIAQLIITPVVLAEFVPVDMLDETVRGTGGFGSTNV